MDAVETIGSYAVVVLHYRAPAVVLECVRAVCAQTVLPRQVVVVDNGSDPDDFAELLAMYPDVQVLDAGGNVGYGAAMRAGQRHIGEAADAVLFLTQDCVLEGSAAKSLLTVLAQQPEIGLAAPVLRRRTDPDVVWSAGGTLEHRSLWTSHLVRPLRNDAYDVAWLDGAALLARKRLFDDVQWDDGYFLYFEDVELSCRARAAGWRTVVVPAAIAYQEPGDLNVYLGARNHLRFVRRNGSRAQLTSALMRHATYLLGDVVRSYSPARRSRFQRRRRGIVDAFTGDLRRPGSPDG